MILEGITEIIKNIAKENKNKVVLSARLRDDLGIESIDIVGLMMQLEDEFDIEFDMSMVKPANFLSVETVYNLVTEMRREMICL